MISVVLTLSDNVGHAGERKTPKAFGLAEIKTDIATLQSRSMSQ
jgi:hypothetical protein